MRTPRELCLCGLSLLAFLALPAPADAEATGTPQQDVAVVIRQLQRKQEQLQEENADLQQQINELREQLAELLAAEKPAQEEAVPAEAEPPPTDELEALRQAAAAAVGEEAGVVAEEPEEVEFKSRGLALQALNPEISVTGDMVNSYWTKRGTRERSDFNFRGLGLHFESYLDPYTRFKAAVSASKAGARLGEAYFTRFGATKDVNLTLGKFRQQFGVVNRWHKHALDQSDFPLPLRSVFGPGGLNQTGLSLDWNMPRLGEAAQELTLQVTDGENPRIFGGNTRNFPSTLLRYKNFRDLTKDTYLEFGLTALAGKNDAWLVQAPGDSLQIRQLDEDGFVTQRRNRWARVYGADVTLLWEPTRRMRYRNFLARSEFYFLKKGILAPDGSGSDTLKAWGFYTDLQSKVSRTVDLGLRTDFFKPDTKPYADIEAASLAPLAVTGKDPNRWLLAPYVTWWQSPWVKYHLEYNYEFGNNMGPSESSIIFQGVFAAGPHKHERY